MGEMKIYEGNLSSYKITGLVKKAVGVFNMQRARCNNPNNQRYKTYGAKGIVVEYSCREFVAWYLDNIENFKGTRADVARKDHDKNYCFENIELQEHRLNAKEGTDRNGPPKKRKKIEIYDYKTGNLIIIAESLHDAARITGAGVANIGRYCSGEYEGKRSGYTMKYHEELK